MAEAAAVATIVGIASFGIQLTQTLYKFGSTVSSAREEVNHIARHVDLYANVLDILTERIDDDEPILSDAAFDLIDELKYQSTQIFNKIGKLYLRRATSKTAADSATDTDLEKQGVRAQNALLAQIQAQDNVLKLENEVARSKALPAIGQPRTNSDLICVNTTAALVTLEQSLSKYIDPGERQHAILQQAAHVLQQLLQQWTTIDHSSSDNFINIQPSPPITQAQTVENETTSRTTNLSDSGQLQHGYPEQSNSRIDSGGSQKPELSSRTKSRIITNQDNQIRSAWSSAKKSNTQIPLKATSADSTDPTASQKANEVLPNGWSKRWSDTKKRWIYYNSKGREIQCDSEWLLNEACPNGWYKHWNSQSGKFDYFTASHYKITPDPTSLLDSAYSEGWTEHYNYDGSLGYYYNDYYDKIIPHVDTLLNKAYPEGWFKQGNSRAGAYEYFGRMATHDPGHAKAFEQFLDVAYKGEWREERALRGFCYYNTRTGEEIDTWYFPIPIILIEKCPPTSDESVAGNHLSTRIGAKTQSLDHGGNIPNTQTLSNGHSMEQSGLHKTAPAAPESTRKPNHTEKDPRICKENPRRCRACDGYGGRSDKVRSCPTCRRHANNNGLLLLALNFQESQQICRTCSYCNNDFRGSHFACLDLKYVCKDCAGTGVDFME